MTSWTGRQHLYELEPTDAEVRHWASCVGIDRAASMINGRLAHLTLAPEEHPAWAVLELVAAALDPKQGELPL